MGFCRFCTKISTRTNIPSLLIPGLLNLVYFNPRTKRGLRRHKFLGFSSGVSLSPSCFIGFTEALLPRPPCSWDKSENCSSLEFYFSQLTSNYNATSLLVVICCFNNYDFSLEWESFNLQISDHLMSGLNKKWAVNWNYPLLSNNCFFFFFLQFRQCEGN